jgi:hypothetical protein
MKNMIDFHTINLFSRIPRVAPLQSQYINDNVPSLGRATMPSAVSMLTAVSVLSFYIGMGHLTDRFSPIVTVTVLGWTLLLGSLFVLLWRKPVITTKTRVGLYFPLTNIRYINPLYISTNLDY